ncbi:hypothetical protein FisN_25Hh106 [Fistulifera solaris]|uniref:Uncharacterized protein n=1 Tax=Fistulifera solaris TaxID=1519565 RepID=A0A1Z5JVR8_FISSO|nr:hypothetical protein FisN_25Hh106 [Fistulifera solaris]|eukprot:GAX18124.1 hypothetical protein FisN_25Hh106 [Fistulifera solaris]
MIHNLIKASFLLTLLSLSVAFQLGPVRLPRLKTQLKAWSLPVPESPTPFGKWYQECDAIGRNRKYEDTPFEYNYVPIFDDSTATNDDSSAQTNTLARQHQSRVPVATSIRKAALLVRRAWVPKK